MAVEDRKRATLSGAQRAFFVILCCLILNSASLADQQQKLHDLRKRISVLQVEMEKTSESKAEAADALRTSERAISGINRKLKVLESKLSSADKTYARLKMQQRNLKASMGEQQQMLNDLLYQRYVGGSREYLNLLLNDDDPNRVSRELTYYRYIAIDRSKRLGNVQSDYLELAEVTAGIARQRDQLAEMRSEHAAEKNALREQKAARKKTLLAVSRQLRSQHREFKQMQIDENRLAKLVEDISEVLEKDKSNSFPRNDRSPDDRYDNLAFSQLRGKLTLPVKGTITNNFGTPRPDSHILWKGLFLRTSSGQAVKAVAAGQVVFADWLRGFGNLMIIDHGGGYMSLYGYNESLYKEVGDQVHGGDTVAATGNSGGNDEYGLYFELRHKSKPLDPAKWLSKR